MPTFRKRTRIDAPAGEVFAWHARPGAFERLTPPWEPVEAEERRGGIENGARLVMRLGYPPLSVRWVAEHRAYIEGRQFQDVQTSGPFSHWVHTHRFEPDGESACILDDHIEYRLPAGPMGELVGGPMTKARLERMFRYRHTVTAHDIAAHRRVRGARPMHVLVTGSHGLVGGALVPFLTTGGHRVTRLVRSSAGPDEVVWAPGKGDVDAVRLPEVDAVVHLAGENISEGRWTDAKKQRILDSRVNGTRLLAETLARMDARPRVLVCASAIGFYGDRGDELVDEQASPGSGFLADVCRQWEAAAQPARDAGIRVVHARFGVILSAAGGALAKMLTPFRLGAGGVIGSGEQYMSWIALDDAVGALHHALTDDALSGPMNVVAPKAVTNREYTKTLGKVLSRPTIFPMPAFAARLAFGEMADELLLASTRVRPGVLEESRYEFRFPALEGALRHLLGAA